MLNLAVLLEGTAREFGDRDAIVCGPTRLTYAQLDAAASQVANALIARGITKGDRIAISCPNVPYFPVIYYGILKAGGVVVPLNILLTEREVSCSPPTRRPPHPSRTPRRWPSSPTASRLPAARRRPARPTPH
jgi:acyl-CoA synthetase (AMP-forming)/AMP-acid ligase II